MIERSHITWKSGARKRALPGDRHFLFGSFFSPLIESMPFVPSSRRSTISVAVQGNNLLLHSPSPVPVISGYGPLTGTSFPLTFSGPNGQSYQVLMSTNVALPLASWAVLSRGTFGGSAVNYTNTSATNALEFYRIKSP